MEKIAYGAGLFTIKEFLTPGECAEYIRGSEATGYEEAAIQTASGSEIAKDIRNNDRIVFDDARLAETLFERAKACLPNELNQWVLSGLNERFRFYRYVPGQYFKWHKDGFYLKSDDEVSLLTFIIYLNDGYEGGNTEFQWEIIKPEAGMALVFPHAMRHQGAAIYHGIKYVLRTDVMYRKQALPQR
ncbi:MAG: putative iron-regulated protein [Polaromonas sp.]|nr:putative iron-regulated protein [Polaromonas sp.]